MIRSTRLTCRLLLIALSIAAMAATADDGIPVGRLHAAYVDDSRRDWSDADKPRPLAATVWYPAAIGDAVTKPWQVGVFDFGNSALDAPFREVDHRWPLIVVSHGTGGSAAQMSWLAQALAARGFIVAGVNHHGNTAAEDALLIPGFTLWWERARDLQVLLDRLLADPRLAQWIDHERIGVAGFSIGGYTAALAVGARVDLEAFARYCSSHEDDDSCRPPPESDHRPEQFRDFLDRDPRARESLARVGEDHRDPRFRAAYLLAPAVAQALDPGSVAAIDIPVSITTGSSDTLILPTLVREMAERIPGSRLQVLDAVGHYTFLAPCSASGIRHVALLCRDADGIDRRDIHARVAADAAAFFARHLRAPDDISASNAAAAAVEAAEKENHP